MRLLSQVLLASVVAGHGYVLDFVIDGNEYAGYTPTVEASYAKLKGSRPVQRIEWAFPQQPYAGAGPVLDPKSPDIACRRNPVAPSLAAKARAGSKIKFQWTNYFIDHKGPVMTYMGELKTPDQKPQTVDFFKIDEGTYDPKTKVWGTDQLIKQNSSWTSTIPSDIKPGRYIVRHEILSLHFSGGRNFLAPGGVEVVKSGAQFYPVCINVDITGSGTATPPGVRFPGAYSLSDPGVKVNSYLGVNSYTPPGPPVYRGKFSPPEGPRPVIPKSQTGFMDKDFENLNAKLAATWEKVVGATNALLTNLNLEEKNNKSPETTFGKHARLA